MNIHVSYVVATLTAFSTDSLTANMKKLCEHDKPIFQGITLIGYLAKPQLSTPR